jgi:apolipoprotein N-acyltransferase
VTRPREAAPAGLDGWAYPHGSWFSRTPVAAALCLSTGLLLMLIFPWYDVEWLAWIALVPLLTVTSAMRGRMALMWGWVSGCVAYVGILRWLPHTMINFAGMPRVVSYGVLLLLVVYVGLYVGVFALGWQWSLRHWPRGTVLTVPALWVALEWIRAQALSGFPWASLGYSQYLNRPLIQLAEFASVYGVSFALVLGNVVIAHLFYGTIHRQWARLALPCGLAVLGLAALWGYGGWRQQEIARAITPTPATLGVALLQGNIAQEAKWDDAARDAIFSSYRTLTLEAAADAEVDLIVWPEAATPFLFANDPVFQARQLRLARAAGRPLLFGSPTYTRDGDQDVMYNSAFLVGPHATVLGRYDKIHLVPFGEYIPLRHLLFFLDKLVQGMGDFRSGEAYTVMAVPQGRFGVLICFEVIFPDLVRHFARHGAQFLVNITNDAWFGYSPASYQHLSMVVFRAIETRLPIVRAANTGISAVIEPTGRLTQQTDLFVRTWIKASITPAGGGPTFYTRWGDVFAYGCVLATAVALGWGMLGQQSRAKSIKRRDADG